MSNMKDALGRTIDYMRISITDRCNLRCKYCMPYGVECVPRWDILSLEEIQAVGICAAGLGIRHIKVTGGEPLVRRDCCQLVKQLKSTPGIEKVTITTNGVLLERYLDDLAEAGIDGINISLDTLDRDLYQRITGTDALGTVMEAVRRACAMPVSVKINAVSIDFSQMDEEQREAGQVFRLSRQTVSLMYRNLFWAFIYNTVGIFVAAGVLYPVYDILLSPALAGAAMALSCVSVALSSLRLSSRF